MVGEIAIPGGTRPRCDAKRDILYIFFIGAKVFVSRVKTGGDTETATFSKLLLGHLDKNSPVGTGPNTAGD